MSVKVRMLLRGELPVEAVNRLLAKLNDSGKTQAITQEQLRESFQNYLFDIVFAEDDAKNYPEKVVGMATIFFQRNLQRWTAEIHDVVVDETYRGQGIGKQLMMALIAHARVFAVAHNTPLTISLTSRPSRVTANLMYQKLGFNLVSAAVGEHGTNLYKFIILPN